MSRGVKLLAGAQLFTAAGIVLFWVLFFAGLMELPDDSFTFMAHEYGWVIPDLVLALALGAGGSLELRGDPRGPVFSLLAAGGLVMLSLYDFSWEVAVNFPRPFVDRALTTLMDLWLLALGLLLAQRLGFRKERQERDLPPAQLAARGG